MSRRRNCRHSGRGGATCDRCRVDRLDWSVDCWRGEQRLYCTVPEGWAFGGCNLRVGGVDGCSSSNPMVCERDMESLGVVLVTFNVEMARLTSWLLVRLGFAIIVRSRPWQNHLVGEDEPRGPVGRVTTASPPQDNRSVWIWMVGTANLRRSCLVVRSRAD